MIVAADLDRTILFSERAIAEFGIPENAKLITVEESKNHLAAYMTETSFSALKELCRKYLFIPVTTRTTEQFERVFIFGTEIKLRYATTTNGAVILENGVPISEWGERIDNALQNESAPLKEMVSNLQHHSLLSRGTLKKVGDLFFYYILDSRPSALERDRLQEWALLNGWRISLQGRKLYFMPKAISKGAALEYISEREGMKVIAGAGDSILDWDFLRNCQHRFVPSHGELVQYSHNKDLIITSKRGMEAGEEILSSFLKLQPLKV